MTLSGITNHNAFYSDHYLETLLAKDLRGTSGLHSCAGVDVQSVLRRYTPRFFRQVARAKAVHEPEQKRRIWQEIHGELLDRLGYEVKEEDLGLDGGRLLVLANFWGTRGLLMWVMSVDSDGEGDVLDAEVEVLAEDGAVLRRISLQKALDSMIFAADEPPRHVMALGRGEVLLFDRAKWGERRYLRFDLVDILGRGEEKTLKITGTLLHRASVALDGGASLLDVLEERSQKHAFGVSEDLKYALRECVELLGNEMASQLAAQEGEAWVFARAEALTRECLTFVYRLLFLFYVEARPELGYEALKSEAYRLGYGLESLRDLEMVELQGEKARGGFFLDRSLRMLFAVVYGAHEDGSRVGLYKGDEGAGALYGAFRAPSFGDGLFDPGKTLLLRRVKLPNGVLQRVIRLMSLSRPSRKRSRRRGRVSYAQLGVNQLGAVYESLASFRGFFAPHDLYEVKKKGKKPRDLLDVARFVHQENVSRFEEDEIVRQKDGRPLVHPQGSFLYRLLREDEGSRGSLYTPEVLTKSVVGHAIGTLLRLKEKKGGISADEILDLTICEPAMGSASFLLAALDELSEIYLRLKQEEKGVKIPGDRYAYEKRRVKSFLAARNVYGVDLNPAAVEAGRIFLWVGSLFQEEGAKKGKAPWLEMQLRVGNSLLGARRQVFTAEMLEKKSKRTSWSGDLPVRVPVGTARPEGSAYHFFLPDEEMALYKDPVVTGKRGEDGIATELVRVLNLRRKAFMAPLGAYEKGQVVSLSGRVDALWTEHARVLRTVREDLRDRQAIFGHEEGDFDDRCPSTHRQKHEVWAREVLKGSATSLSPYRRLQMVMDCWCALWFWPIEEAESFPTRNEYLFAMEVVLDPVGILPSRGGSRVEADFGSTDLLIKKSRFLQIANRIAREEQRFLHWELEFADIFAERGGFDLVLGHPPWFGVRWKEQNTLAQMDHVFALRKMNVLEVSRRRKELLCDENHRLQYLSAYAKRAGEGSFLGAAQNRLSCKGVSTNLYKSFLMQGMSIGRDGGAVGMVHRGGVYDDPRGGSLREELYRRLDLVGRFHAKSRLFGEGRGHCFSCFRVTPGDEPRFSMVCNVFHPQTIDESLKSSGVGSSPGLKNKAGAWDLRGHRDRIVQIDRETLTVFARLYEKSSSSALQARLPVVHDQSIMAVLEKIAGRTRRLGDLDDFSYVTDMWNETREVKRGTIRREVGFVEEVSSFVFTGAHFSVGNPLHQTYNEGSRSTYSTLDLEHIPEDYLPRTAHRPACDPEEYAARVTAWKGKPITGFYRHVHRKIIASEQIRTLVPAIIPPETAHMVTVMSVTMENPRDLLLFNAMASSLPVDFFVKTTGRGDWTAGPTRSLPFPEVSEELADLLIARAARLHCLTIYYKTLWETAYRASFAEDRFVSSDPRLQSWGQPGPLWTRETGFRLDFARRQALVEIDVLAARVLGLSLDELKRMYENYFSGVQKQEREVFYDRRGKIVSGVDDDVLAMKDGVVRSIVLDTTLPGGPMERVVEYEAPFGACDREKDYETAWAHFSERLELRERRAGI